MTFKALRAAFHWRCAAMYERLANDRTTRARYHDACAQALGYPRRRRPVTR